MSASAAKPPGQAREAEQRETAALAEASDARQQREHAWVAQRDA